MAGHVAALGLVLVKRATPAVVDLVLALGLSHYLGVPIPRGTDMLIFGSQPNYKVSAFTYFVVDVYN
jgi:hypothetical protein